MSLHCCRCFSRNSPSLLPAILALLLFAAPAAAALVERNVDYADGDTALQGYLVYDDTFPGKRAGVLVVHEWNGLAEHPRRAARDLAALGYVAFALDMYGKGVLASGPKESAALAKPFYEDRDLMRRRAKAGLAQLRARPEVEPEDVAAIGFCFGGTTVLELARAGTDLAGVVSFHGGLATPRPATRDNLKASVLVLHGAADPHVPEAEVQSFMQEMRAADADWQLVYLGGAVHSFTNPQRPLRRDAPDAGAAYDPRARRRAWEYMKVFLCDLF